MTVRILVRMIELLLLPLNEKENTTQRTGFMQERVSDNNNS